MTSWQENAEQELEAAHEALRFNLEGRARVAARRAAGIAIREYLRQHGAEDQDNNYFHLLLRASEDQGLPLNMRILCRHLSQRVDANYSLPEDIDLVEDARVLIRYIAKHTNLSLEGKHDGR